MLEAPHPPTAAGLIRRVLGAQRGRIALGAAAGTVGMGAAAVLPVVLGRALDAAAGGEVAEVARWCAVIALAFGVDGAAGIVRHRTAVALQGRTRWHLERLVTRRILTSAGAGRHAPGVGWSMASSDAGAIALVADLMCRGTGSVVTLIVAGVALLHLSPVLGLVVLIGLPPSILVLLPLWRPMDRRSTALQSSVADTAAVAVDIIGGFRVVRSLHAEDRARGWFAAEGARLRVAAVAHARLGGAWSALSGVVPGLFLAVVAVVGGRLVLAGELTVGGLVAVTGLAAFLATPLVTLAEMADMWVGAVASARRIAGLLGPDEDANPEPRTPALPPGLTGVVAADQREVDAFVASVRDLAPDALVEEARRPWLADATLATNLRLGAPMAEVDALVGALEAAAATELLVRSDGLEARVGERGRFLSGGQRQRVAVARALVADPDELVLIEPTSALDTVTAARVVEGIAAARSGRSTVVISTTPAVLARCDRVWSAT